VCVCVCVCVCVYLQRCVEKTGVAQVMQASPDLANLVCAW
jgi:hypothetical protein